MAQPHRPDLAIAGTSGLLFGQRRLVAERDDADDYAAEYFFNLASNRVRKDVDTDGDGQPDERTTYEYDQNDRLLEEVFDLGLDGADKTTTYEYGAANDRTEQTLKSVWDDVLDELAEEVQYTYNVRGRLETVIVDSVGDGTPNTTSTYEYNDSGTRVSQTVDDGTTVETTIYVVDSNNHTGYAQVLEEGTDANTDGRLDVAEIEKTYTIGHDVIAQQADDIEQGDTLFFLYDGHGSTRALINDQLALVQKYLYDAYGNMLPGAGLTADPSTALTSLLYSGEQTDITGLQYLRARFYDPSSGRFNRLDPYAGNLIDPLSLHKYLYVHANPVMGIDPSGLFTIAGTVSSITIGATLGGTLGGIDAALGGESIIAGVLGGAAVGGLLGIGVYAFPAFFASKYVVGVGYGLAVGIAAEAFANGKNLQGAFRVFTGLAVPLALRNAAIARLAGFARDNLAGLWRNVKLRSNFYNDADVAGSMLSQRIPVNRATPGRYTYVVDESGQMWLGPENAKHPSLMPADAQVRAAGHIVIEPNQTARLNSRSGHYMAEDPIGFAGDPGNLYRYVENGPTNGTDPSGLKVVHVRNGLVRDGDFGAEACPSYHINDFYAYVAPGATPPNGTIIPLTPDESRLVSAANGRRALEDKLVTIFNSVNHSGNGYSESFNYYWFDELPNGNEPNGSGACFAWTAAQRSTLPESGSGLTVTEVQWTIYSWFSSIGAWSNHSAVRLEIAGYTLVPNGTLTVAYIDNGWIGGSDGIFFQQDIPGNYWNETPGRLVDGSYAQHAGDPP